MILMIVEDEEPLQMLLRYNLESEGFPGRAVTRGEEAHPASMKSAPTSSCSTGCCPALSGIEVCRRPALAPRDPRLPVIMLTARGEENERVRGLATGADDYG
jgi:two-component system phosphate regulon response regulator PhoB